MFDEIDNNQKRSSGEVEEKKEEINKEEQEGDDEKKLNNDVEDIFSSESDDIELENNMPDNHSFNKGKEKPAVFNAINEEENEKNISESNFPFLKIVIIFLFLVILAIGVYFAYEKYLKNYILNKANPVEEELKENVIDTVEGDKNILIEPGVENDEEKYKNNNVTIDELDSDGDGLSDQRETALGININNIDTDGDGLFDREEVEVYKTNPKNRDSDGDGFSDGDEVSAGYNPNGEGKLYNINKIE